MAELADVSFIPIQGSLRCSWFDLLLLHLDGSLIILLSHSFQEAQLVGGHWKLHRHPPGTLELLTFTDMPQVRKHVFQAPTCSSTHYVLRNCVSVL